MPQAYNEDQSYLLTRHQIAQILHQGFKLTNCSACRGDEVTLGGAPANLAPGRTRAGSLAAFRPHKTELMALP